MFKDARARRAWRLYFLRAEAAMSPLSSSVRRELIDDLQAHVRDVLANDKTEGDELAKVQAALGRVGNPREFLAPLVADAVFRARPQHGSFAMTYRTLALYASRGTSYFLRALGLVLAAASGILIALAALNRLFRPESAGLFQLGADEYQLRVFGFGEAAGEQLLAPWLAVLLIAAGIAVVIWCVRVSRRFLLELIAGP